MKEYDIFSGRPGGGSPLWIGVVNSRQEAEVRLGALAETGKEFYAINLLTRETVRSVELQSGSRD